MIPLDVPAFVFQQLVEEIEKLDTSKQTTYITLDYHYGELNSGITKRVRFYFERKNDNWWATGIEEIPFE